jgi:peptide/nickel transport system substrate-binding protein
MKDQKALPGHDLPKSAIDALFDMAISRRRLMVAVAAASTATLAPRLYAQDEKRPRKGQVIVGLTQEPTVFNPLMPYYEADSTVFFALFNPLWHVEPDGSLVPDLAVEVPSLDNGGISSDGLSWNVKLRKGIKWHDGHEFTADDVKFTIDLINNPKFRAKTRQGHNLVTDIKIHSPYEISWKMTSAYAPYLTQLTWTMIVPKHVLGAVADPNTAPFNSAPIGTGPFKWGSRTAGNGVTVVANPDYFGTGPFVERVVFNYVPDANVLYTQFKTGQIDYAGYNGIPANYFKEAKALPDRKVVGAPIAQIAGIALNFGRPYFAEKAVRRAMYAGLNKKAIIDLIYYGLPNPSESYLPKSSSAFNPDLPKQVYDLAAANRLLDEAGWIRGSDGVRVKNGVRLAFNTATISGNPQREQTLQLIQQDWKQLGIAMSIKTMPAAVVYGDYYTKSQFDSLLLSSSYGTGADPDCTQRFSSASIPIQGGNGTNYYQYKNPEVDKLLLAGQRTFKVAERQEVYRRIQSVIREDLAFLPIFQEEPVEGTKSKLMGYRPNANVQTNCWNFGGWYWEA